MAQKTVLGKGLASLLPTMNPNASGNSGIAAGATVADVPPSASNDTTNRDRHLGISVVPIDEIQANHFQPRRDFDDNALAELAQSIKTSGIIQPLLVRRSTSKDGYELIAGERRLRAAKMAGLKQVPIVLRKSTDRETLELALIENIQRENLNCIDESLAYFQLIQDFSLTQEEVAERVGKDRATISNYLRLLRLPEEIIEDLKNQVLSFGHGKALLGLEDNPARLRARKKIIEEKLSVRETEALVEAMKRAADPSLASQKETSATALGPIASRLNQASRELTRHWSAKVEIKGNEKKGKIIIHYSTRQELDRLLEDMQTERV